MKRVNRLFFKRFIFACFFFLSGLFLFAEEKFTAMKTVVNIELTMKDPVLKESMASMDDFVGARITGPYFSYIDRSLVIKNFNKYIEEHPLDKKKRVDIQKNIIETSNADFSNILQLAGSEVSIAELLGADVIVNISVFEPIKEKRSGKIDGLVVENIFYTQQLSYNVFNLQTSASIFSGQIKESRIISNTENVQTENNNLRVSLIQAGLEKVGDDIIKKASVNKKPVDKGDIVPVSFSFSFEDVIFPMLIKTSDGGYVVSQEKYNLFPKSVNISANGIDYPLAVDVNGNTSAIDLPKGRPVQIVVSRKDFNSISRVIKISKSGQRFSMDLTFSDEARAKLKADLAEMTAIADASKITDAQAGVLAGKKKFWEQSGFRIDVRRSTQGTEKVEIKEEYKKEALVERAE